MKQQSTMYKLLTRDFLKALIMAIGAPVLTFLYDSLKAENFVFEWKKLLIVAASAGVAYLIKNFFTDDIKISKEILKNEN